MRRMIFFIVLLAGLGAACFGENYLSHQIYASAMVVEPEEASEKIGTWAESVGGYYVLKSSDRVVVRIPEERVSDLKAYLEKNTVELYEYVPAARNVREEMLYLQSAIESREEILVENLEYLDRADVTGTLAIEKEVMEILRELEELKGRLKMLNRNRTFAYAEISLTFQTQTLPEKIPSSFTWLSALDFYSFIQRGF